MGSHSITTEPSLHLWEDEHLPRIWYQCGPLPGPGPRLMILALSQSLVSLCAIVFVSGSLAWGHTSHPGPHTVLHGLPLALQTFCID